MPRVICTHNPLSTLFAGSGGTGPLRYMAPEVLRGKPYNETADVYSFALILWQMLTGCTPFEGLGRSDFMQRVGQNKERPPLDLQEDPSGKLTVNIGGKLRVLLRFCWCSNHRKRYSATQTVQVLTEINADLAIDRKSCCGYL